MCRATRGWSLLVVTLLVLAGCSRSPEAQKARCLDRGDDGARVRVSSPVRGTLAEASDRLVRYAQVLYPVLGEYLPD